MGALTSGLVHLEGKRVYFDTNPIIYFLNRSPGFFEAVLPLFQGIEEGQFEPFSGEVCLAELLVKPLSDHDITQTRQIKTLFDQGLIKLVPHDREVFELAASIRALQKLKMIDALHAATAIRHNCQVFVTADAGIAERLRGIEVLTLQG